MGVKGCGILKPGRAGVQLRVLGIESSCDESAAAVLDEHAEELARLQTAEMGKPSAESRGGVDAGVSAMRE